MIKWTEKTVKVSALKPFERNPRKISEADYARLKKSLTENGYHQRVLATKDLRVVGGHQRIRVLKDLGIKEIAVLVTDEELTDDQFRRILIQDNLPFGSWDFDLLSADFEVDELIDFGMPESWLGLGEEADREDRKALFDTCEYGVYNVFSPSPKASIPVMIDDPGRYPGLDPAYTATNINGP
jgi:hypothetical protein